MKIVLSIVLTMFLVSCSDDKSTQKVSPDNTKQLDSKVNKTMTTELKNIVAIPVKKELVPNSVEVKVKEKITEKKVIKHKEVNKSVQNDGEKIFMKCISCHGKTGERKALNKSQVIKGWESGKIIKALKGYKNGTYGSSMKGVMKPQVSKLSDVEIEAVSKYISKL